MKGEEHKATNDRRRLSALLSGLPGRSIEEAAAIEIERLRRIVDHPAAAPRAMTIETEEEFGKVNGGIN